MSSGARAPLRLRRRAVERLIDRRVTSMSARVEQAKWAVILMMRENRPGSLQFDPRRIRTNAVAFDLALGGFSRAISSADPEGRRVAARALTWMSDRRAISPLIRGLRDRLWHVRYEAAHGLGCLGPLPDWALPALVRAVEDPEPAVRAEAAWALGRLPSPDSLRPLVLALYDRSRTVRLAGASALDQLGVDGIAHERAAERLGRLMEEERDPFVAYAAYRGFRAQGGPVARAAAFRASEWGQKVVGCRPARVTRSGPGRSAAELA